MPLLSKDALLGRVLNGIEASGWRWQIERKTHPFKVRAFRDNADVRLLIYVWNITHGGGVARPPDEYRIQLTGVTPPLMVEPKVNTLLLGWSETWALFAAYDVTRHMTFSQASPSIQFRKDVVVAALASGVGFHRRTNGELVVVFRPEFLMTYAERPNLLHRSTVSHVKHMETHIAEVAAVVDGESITRPTDETIERRDPAAAMVSRALRDNGFRARVVRAYAHSCAACGLQFDILDAAHIVPVSDVRNFSTRNGLCLCPNHHRAYDNRLVSIHGDFHIEVDSEMVAHFRRTHKDQGKALLLDSLHRFLHVPANPLEQPAPNLLIRRLELDRAVNA